MKKNLLAISSLLLAVIANAQWTPQATGFSTPSRGIINICVVDPSTVWVSTYDGSGGGAHVQDFSRTLDGGNTWSPGTVTVPNPADYAFSNLWAVDANTAWALMYNATAGTGGGVFKTTDGGVNWAQQGAGTIFNATSFPDVVYFWDANKGIVIGDPNGPGTTYYEIYNTTNGGSTWTRVPSANIAPKKDANEYGVSNSFAVQGNTFWFGTSEGRVYKSTDGGSNWTVSSAFGGGDQVSDISFLDSQTGIATTYNVNAKTYSYYKTTNGGTSWSPLNVVSGTLFNGDLGVVPGSGVIVSTSADTAAAGSSYSMDAGANWTTIDNGTQHTAQGWASDQTGWCGGFNTDNVTGGIFKYATPFTAISALSKENEKMSLYPNPSNGRFTMMLATNEIKAAVVTITDVAGNVVDEGTIQNKSGFIQKSFDLSGTSKGIYFVNVTNGITHVSRKIVIQ